MQLILKAIEAWSCIYLFSADNLYLSCCIYAVEILYRVSKYKTQLDPTAYKTASFNACSFNPFHALSGSPLTLVMLDPHMGEPIPWDQGYCGSTYQIRRISYFYYCFNNVLHKLK